MIIPFTDRLKAAPVVAFATVVFIVQQLEHTDVTFSVLTFLFTILSVIAYNVAGGLSYPSGAFIFFNATLTVIVGLTYKLFLGEPGESNLLAPNLTLLTYCVGMLMMAITAAFNTQLRSKRALLPNLEPANMRYAALGCLFAGIAVQLLTYRNQGEEGTISSALHQLNYLPRMGLVFATLYQINKTDGKKATNWMVWLAGAFTFGIGIIDFSKEGLFTAPVTWLLTCVLYRFRFNWKHVTAMVLFGVVSQVILVPFSQYGRRSRADATITQAMALQSAIEYLEDPFGTRDAFLDEISTLDTSGQPHLYATQQPFMERLSMFAPDDALVALTDKGQTAGLFPIYVGYTNVVPRFIWKDKPTFGYGNSYAHELGILPYEDTTTGISFSPTADAFHEAKWFGIFALMPPILFLFFFITDSLTGNVNDTPYALLPIALVAHAAPEGLLVGAIYLQTYGAALLIIIAFLAKNLLARMTLLTMGGDRVRVFRTRDFILGQRQATPVPQPGSPGAPRP